MGAQTIPPPPNQLYKPEALPLMSELLTEAEEKQTEQPGDISRSVIIRWWMLSGGVLGRVVGWEVY